MTGSSISRLFEAHSRYSLPDVSYNALKKAFYTNIHLQILAGGLLLNFLLAIMYRYINAGSPFLSWRELPGFYTQGWPIMLQTFVILYVVHFTIRYFNNKYQSNPNGFARFLRELLVVLVLGFALMESFRWVFVTYMVVPEEDTAFLDRKLKMILTIDITFLIVVYAFMTSFGIFRYLQRKNIEVARWQREYLQTQFEAMKNQLNPHFLFNSLSALSALVYVDANLAESFIEKLSRSYRYLLEQRDKQTVSLEQELQFLDSFVFLTGQRFVKKLQVMVEPMDASGYALPPHSLMIVMEYILETTSMSAAKPLRVTISKGDAALIVTYSRQPKKERGDGTQFERLQQQFVQTLRKQIRLTETGEHFQMRIPLQTYA